MTEQEMRRWCCKHSAMLWYIAICVTLLLLSAIAETEGWWG